ncbi:MAG: hypothetical protein AB7F79_02900 [Steroidobacteraceae bacterium]
MAPTIAALLSLRLTENGSLLGRNVGEALHGRAPTNDPAKDVLQQCLDVSTPSANGRATILRYQLYGASRYNDVAEFRIPAAQERSGCSIQPGLKPTRH